MNPLLPTRLNLFSIYKPLSHSLPACLNKTENPIQDIPQVPGSNNNTRCFYNGGPLLVYFFRGRRTYTASHNAWLKGL